MFDRPRSKRDPVHQGVWRTAKRRKRTSYGRNRGPVDREGCGVPQNGGNGPPTVETGVLLIGRGVAYRKTEEMDLLRSKRWSCSSGRVWRTAKRTKRTSYGRNGGPIHREGCGIPQNGTPWDTVHFHRRPPPASTSYCSSTVDLLQPPPATVHPRAPVHPASTARYFTGYCSTTPLHGLLFNHPSTGYC